MSSVDINSQFHNGGYICCFIARGDDCVSYLTEAHWIGTAGTARAVGAAWMGAETVIISFHLFFHTLHSSTFFVRIRWTHRNLMDLTGLQICHILSNGGSSGARWNKMK